MDTVETAGRKTSFPSDLGLLILRVGLGTTMIQAGLIKALGFGTTTGYMGTSGWRSPTFAAALVTAAETAGGIGLLLGLLTPLAACAVTAAMIDAWAATVAGTAFWSEPVTVPFVTAFGAAALLFTGAGAYSLDSKLIRRSRWPGLITVPLFLFAVAAAIATWVVLNGVNPIHLDKPAS